MTCANPFMLSLVSLSNSNNSFEGSATHFDKVSPKNIEKPSMNKFRVEFKLTNWRFDNPTDETMPNMTQKMPPIIGSGIVTNNAPNLENRPNIIIIKPPTCITRRLPTFVTPMAPIFSE